jgi:hypothetical protein
MPKVKAGTLKPVIDQIRRTLVEKAEGMSPAERRRMRHRLKRVQRKARRIRGEEEGRTRGDRGDAGKAAAPGEAAG